MSARPRPCCLLFLFLLFTLVFLLVFSVPAQAWDAVVIRVVDGDTLVVAPKSASRPAEAAMGVRLYGIDAPELHQSGGQAAKAALEALAVPGARVDIIPVESDRYDRAVGLALLNGTLLNLEQIRSGHARVHETYCRARFCPGWKQIEKEARSRQRLLQDAEWGP